MSQCMYLGSVVEQPKVWRSACTTTYHSTVRQDGQEPGSCRLPAGLRDQILSGHFPRSLVLSRSSPSMVTRPRQYLESQMPLITFIRFADPLQVGSSRRQFLSRVLKYLLDNLPISFLEVA